MVDAIIRIFLFNFHILIN